jgi:hypothetical protein
VKKTPRTKAVMKSRRRYSTMAGAAPASRSGAVASPISLSDSRISEIPIRMRPV